MMPEETAPPPPPRRIHKRKRRIPHGLLKQLLLPFGLVVFALIGGVNSPFAQGLIALAAGWLWLTRPPEKSPGRLVDCAAIAFIGSILLGLIPSGHYAWQYIAGELSVSPLPMVTLHTAVLGVLLIALFYSAYNSVPIQKLRMPLFTGTAALIGLLAVLGALGLFADANGLDNEAEFHFLGNLLEAHLVLVIGGALLLAASMENARRNPIYCGLAAVGTLLCMAAMVIHVGWFSVIAFIFIGFVWLLVRMYGQRTSTVFRSIVVALLLGVFVLSYGIKKEVGIGDPIINEPLRPALLDGFNLVRSHWAEGIGAGAISEVWPYARTYTLAMPGDNFPPSVWMLLLVELGIVGLLAVSVAMVVAGAQLLPIRRHHSSPERLACVAALAGIFAISFFAQGHAFLWSALLAIWLWRLALPVKPKGKGFLLPKWAGRIAGVIFCLVGITWLAASIALPGLHPSSAKKAALRNAQDLYTEGDQYGFQLQLETALRWNRLDGDLYYQAGRGLLNIANDIEEAQALFNQAIAADPLSVDVPMAVATEWLKDRHAKQAQETLHIVLERGRFEPEKVSTQVLALLEDYRWFDDELAELSLRHPYLRTQYLLTTDPDNFASEIGKDLAKHPALWHLPAQFRFTLLTRWLDTADPLVVEEIITTMPAETHLRWYYQAKAAAAQTDYATAWMIAQEQLPEPLELAPSQDLAEASLLTLAANFEANKTQENLSRAYFYRLYKEEQWLQLMGAVELLKQANPTNAEAHYWSGQAHKGLGNDRDAWESLERFVLATPPLDQYPTSE